MGVRLLSVFVELALILALTGCTGKNNSREQATNQQGKESNTLPPSEALWTAGTDISKFDLLAIDFVDQQNGWTVGDISPEGGPLLRTTDGGNSWQVIARTTEVFSAIQFINSSTGWMTGYAGRIERTDDGGRTWKTQRFEREGDVLNALHFIDQERGWAVGGHGLLLRTTDGGNHWEQIATNRVEDLWAVRFASGERGWLVGEDGLILATTDGGATWTKQKSGTAKALLGLTLLPSGSLIAVGQSGTILRSQQGSDWLPVTSGTTAMLNAVAAADSQTLWAVGSDGTSINSNDGGKTWKSFAPVSSRHLLAIDLVNSRRGFAVGRRGAIQKLQEKE
jgi:photosystem II stability/assembly factor-like uncharacterized protein